MNGADLADFGDLRQSVFDYIKACLDEDGHCKSYEGTWELSTCYPSYFEREKPPTYCLTLHCYLIGPNRHYDWHGDSWAKCLKAARRDVTAWKRGDFSIGELKYRHIAAPMPVEDD